MTDIQQFIQQYALEGEVKASRGSPSSSAKSSNSKKRQNRLLPFAGRKGRKTSGTKDKDRVRNLVEVCRLLQEVLLATGDLPPLIKCSRRHQYDFAASCLDRCSLHPSSLVRAHNSHTLRTQTSSSSVSDSHLNRVASWNPSIDAVLHPRQVSYDPSMGRQPYVLGHRGWHTRCPSFLCTPIVC